MAIRPTHVSIMIGSALLFLGASICLAPRAVAVSNEPSAERAIFENIGLISQAGQPVVKLLPVQDKREVAVCGLVNMQVPPRGISRIIHGEHGSQERCCDPRNRPV